MRKLIFLALVSLSSFAFGEDITTLYTEQTLHINESETVVQLEPGFRAHYIEISALAGQFKVDDVEITNQFNDVLNINRLIGLDNNRKSFGGGMIDKTGNPSIPGKVRLFVGHDVSVERIKITLIKKAAVEGAVQVSVLVDSALNPVVPPVDPGQPVEPNPPPVKNPPIVPPVVGVPIVQPPPPVDPIVEPGGPVIVPEPPVVVDPNPAPVIPPPISIPPAAGCTAIADTRALDRVESMIRSAEQIQAIQNVAGPGSVEERNARTQLGQIKAEVDKTLNNPNMKNYEYRALESMVVTNHRRHARTFSGTMLETITNSAIDGFGKAMVASVQRELGCGRMSVRSVIEAASDYDDESDNAPNGSTLEGVYNRVATAMWGKLPEVFTREASRITDYRDAEDRGMDYNRAYERAGRRRNEAQAMGQLALTAFKRSQDILRAQIGSMSPRDRERLASEYRRMAEKARSGSFIEGHALAMRSIVGR